MSFGRCECADTLQTLVIAGVMAPSGVERGGSGVRFETTDAGVVIGLWRHRRRELRVWRPPREGHQGSALDLGGGVLGVEGSFDYHHYNYVPRSRLRRHHGAPNQRDGQLSLPLKNQKVDPFLGLGLGYEHISWNCGVYDCSGAGSSGIHFVGARAFVTT